MNGTEHSVDFLSKTIDITDTEAILETMDKYNLGLAALRNFSSIFMGFLKGNPFVVADNTVSIKVLNNADEEGKINWVKNAIDEYVVNLIYSVEDDIQDVGAPLESPNTDEGDRTDENKINLEINSKLTL